MVAIALIVPNAPFLAEPRSFPHLGILYISASLKRVGYRPKVYDLTGGATLPKISADIIGITASSPLFHSAINIMNEIRKYNRNALFVIGGPHATVAHETCVQAGFDVTISGEGEEAMVEVARTFDDGWERIPPVIMADPIHPLDKLPYPDRDAIDMSKYHYYLLGEKCTNIQTQRGCSYGCAFCCGRETSCYRWARQRSVENVRGEIQILKEKYGIGALMFFDDEFNLNKKHTLEMCKMLKEEDIIWRCMIRSNLFDEELAKAMADAGCKEIGCGVETGSPTIKKNVNKGTTIEQDYKARELCRKYNIKFKCFIVVGLPGENYQTFNETREWIRKAQPENFDYTILVPYPGSPIWNHPEKYDIQFDKDEIIKSHFADTFYKGEGPDGSIKSFVSTSALSRKEIMRLRMELEKEFPRMISPPWSGTEKK